MSLPEIPDEAVQAAIRGWRDGHPLKAQPPGSGYVTTQGMCDAILAGAWPHLYAAALRHAADVALPRDRTSHRPMEYEQIQGWLTRLADEAEAS